MRKARDTATAAATSPMAANTRRKKTDRGASGARRGSYMRASARPAAVGTPPYGLRSERAGRAVDRLHQLHAATALVAVAGGPRARLDRTQEVFDEAPMAARVADHGR